MKRLTRWAAMPAAVLLLAACGGGKEIEKAEAQDVLVVLRGDKSEILDPHATNSGGDANLIQQMYEGLVKPSESAPVTWEPCLAESFSTDDAYRVYTFKLRKGVKFHDGAELNAAAVKRSFDRCRNIKDKAAPPKLPYAAEYFSDIESIETPDESTVVFKLKDTNPKFLSNCGLFSASIVSPKAIATMEKESDAAKRQGWLTRHPAGTGPFTIAVETDYQNAETITMTAFEGYWGGKPAIPLVVFKWNEDVKNRREQIMAGEVQVVDSPAPVDWKDLDASESITLHSWKAENLCYLGMNVDPTKGFPTADIKVRRAIAMAVDRDPLVALYDGTAVAHHVLLPPVSLGYPEGYMPSTDRGPRNERLAKARELIREAGAEGAELRLLLPPFRPYLGKPGPVADHLRQQLAEIGLKITLERQPMNELGDSITNGAAPLVLIGWMGETGEPDDFWRPLLSGNGKPSDNNVPRFYNAEVAAKIDEGLKARGNDKRRAIYEDLEKWVHEEFRPMVPLLSAMQAVAWRSDVEGIFVDSTGTYRLYKARYKAN
jgi:ABC-type transport system substrate-binding protein